MASDDLEYVQKVVEEDNERFLRILRDGIDHTKIEIGYENVSVEGDAYVGSRALPTLMNSVLNIIEGALARLKMFPSKKRVVKLLDDVSGIAKPSRMTLLLGPPGSGKTTLLKALAGVLDKNLKVKGRITYCGHEMSEFVSQRACYYIGQHDLHQGEMTVRETLEFSARCLRVGNRYEVLADHEMDTFTKADAVGSQESSLVADHVLKILGLDSCADAMVGDEMRRGISGGEKKRLTTGEMLVGPAKVFFMDEISTGLDSSTTYRIIKYLTQMVRIMDMTMVISLLQPAQETFELFDDIILLSEGKIVYQGPRDHVLSFFKSVGFKCPERKGVADFLQEVTSKKDQEQYWFRKNEPYRYISVAEFVQRFISFHVGKNLHDELAAPYDKPKTRPAALVTEKYGISSLELFKVCLSKEWLLMKRNSFLYVFKTVQITIMSIMAFTVFFRTEMKHRQLRDGWKFYDALFFSLFNVMFNGMAEIGMTIFRLPVFFKQRDSLFYPAWSFAIPYCLLRIPLSFMESLIWIVLTYYTIGFAPDDTRFFRQFLVFLSLHQTALSLFRLLAAIGRTMVLANAIGTFAFLLLFVFGGFMITKDDIETWMKWGYYASPMTYALNALAINEFLDKRWSTPNTDAKFPQATVGKVLLASKGMFSPEYMYWICIIALFGFSLLFNICFIVALTYLNPLEDSKSVIIDESNKSKKTKQPYRELNKLSDEENGNRKRGLVLPFQPLSLAFNNVNYYINMPIEMKKHGIGHTRLQLLQDVSGAFRPGVLTALVGLTGAGKTTLMDVLAGRKTVGYIEGSIRVSGYPKSQSTFARISGYCEQNDIHSPHITVYESLVYSAVLRLSTDIEKQTREMFVREVMELVELNTLSDALVGLPGVNGLSTEQRKRLTIAVELVANPSIIFMDEPTAGLDARAAAIVMRTVRNTVDTGRTVVCTIHQPGIDIFESFDELLLMKLGGQVIYAGPLGHHSRLLIEYFQSIPGVPRIKEGYNPATWMLEITTPAAERQLNADFRQIYADSDLYRRNQELIDELSTPKPGSEMLHFLTRYSQSFTSQCKTCFWKQNLSYWRNPQYNAIRYLLSTLISITLGVVYWNKGHQLSKQQDLLNFIGAMYAAVMFLGVFSAASVLPVVDIERTVFYREKAAGMYSTRAYAFAQVAVEIIYIAIQTCICSAIIYSMIGFEWGVVKFLWFYYYAFMCLVYFTLYGMMIVSLTPSYPIAAITMTMFLNFWNLFSGFMIPRREIPVWWRWYYWCSPTAWTIYGLVTSQIGEKTDPVEVPGVGDVPVKDFLNIVLGYEDNFLGGVALAHVAWAVLFCFVFAYAIKLFNFQRR